MSWGSSDHECEQLKYRGNPNPHDDKVRIELHWYGYSIHKGNKEIQITFCPFCGRKLLKSKLGETK